jgi:hypothetical protein
VVNFLCSSPIPIPFFKMHKDYNFDDDDVDDVDDVVDDDDDDDDDVDDDDDDDDGVLMLKGN